MQNALEAVTRVLPVILLILAGYGLRRSRFLREDTVGELKKLVVNITLPALLFNAFSGTAFEGRYALIVVTIFLTCCLMLLAGGVIRRVYREKNRYYPSVFSGFETGMMGYSLFVAVYGADQMFKLALVDVGQGLFVFFVLVTWLRRTNGQSSTPGEVLVSFVKSPVILAILAGIASGSTGAVAALKALPVAGAVPGVLELLGGLTVPLICMVIGYELQVNRTSLGRPLRAVLTRMGLLLGVAFLINTVLIDRVLGLDPVFHTAVYTLFLLPPPLVIPIFMREDERENRQMLLNVISLHILLSLVAFVLLILIAG